MFCVESAKHVAAELAAFLVSFDVRVDSGDRLYARLGEWVCHDPAYLSMKKLSQALPAQGAGVCSLGREV